MKKDLRFEKVFIYENGIYEVGNDLAIVDVDNEVKFAEANIENTTSTTINIACYDIDLNYGFHHITSNSLPILFKIPIINGTAKAYVESEDGLDFGARGENVSYAENILTINADEVDVIFAETEQTTPREPDPKPVEDM